MLSFFKRFFFTFSGALVLLLTLSLFGCEKKEDEITKVKDLDFTVVKEADLPTPLLDLINSKKNGNFCFTYKSADSCYICQGFGTQPSSGYSIRVDELFLGTNAIYIKNTLIGPGKEELVMQTATHPYIVVKIELLDYNVVFE